MGSNTGIRKERNHMESQVQQEKPRKQSAPVINDYWYQYVKRLIGRFPNVTDRGIGYMVQNGAGGLADSTVNRIRNTSSFDEYRHQYAGWHKKREPQQTEMAITTAESEPETSASVEELLKALLDEQQLMNKNISKLIEIAAASEITRIVKKERNGVYYGNTLESTDKS